MVASDGFMDPVKASGGGFNGTMVLVTVFGGMVYATVVVRVRLLRQGLRLSRGVYM